MPYDKRTAKKKWTIDMMKVYRKFCGWDAIQALIDSVDYGLVGPLHESLIRNDVEKEEGKALIATTFLTGARISEVIGQPGTGALRGLQNTDFNVRTGDERYEDYVNIIFNIAKKYRKAQAVIRYRATDGTKLRWKTEEEADGSKHPYEPYEGYETVRKVAVRSVAIPLSERFADVMMGWVQKKEGKLFNVSYNRAYRLIKACGREIGEDFPPHRLRAERATQMALERGLTDSELTEWFAWKSPVTAHDYTTLAPQVLDKTLRRR